MRPALAIVMLLSAALRAPAQQSVVEFDSARWTMLDPGGRVMPYLGRTTMFLDRGLATVADAPFGDGTIEFDVAIHGHAGFAGVAFRGQSSEDYELVYLRTHRSRQWDALQYTPIFAGQEAWQLYSGDGYTAAAELPANRWVRVRLVVAGYTAKVYVGGAAEPQLTVTDLKRPWARGFVGLWGRAGAANFSNVTIVPEEGAAPRAPDAAPVPGVIRRWWLSPAREAPAASADRLPVAGDASRDAWEPVIAEPSGILKIGRYRRGTGTGRDPRRSPRHVVLARALLTAQAAQRVRLSFGYSDEVTVFLNGRPLFAGRAAFLERDGSFLGIMTVGADALFLDLEPGRNELVLAVTETFGGWGVAARVDPAAGVLVDE